MSATYYEQRGINCGEQDECDGAYHYRAGVTTSMCDCEEADRDRVDDR